MKLEEAKIFGPLSLHKGSNPPFASFAENFLCPLQALASYDNIDPLKNMMKSWEDLPLVLEKATSVKISTIFLLTIEKGKLVALRKF